MNRNDEIDLEEEKDDGDESFRGSLSFDISEISIKTEQQSADFIIDMLRHDEIDMDTPFQRSPDLWKADVMSRFIESMLLKFPIPPFYFDISYRLDKSGKQLSDSPYWQVVDGLQRLSAIRRFVTVKDARKKLRLTGLDFFSELEGCTYEELPRSLRRNLHSCQISMFVIYPNTPKSVKHRIFERVNTGGLKLTDQEIRHAINQGNSNSILADATLRGLVNNGIKLEPGRMRDQELVLRHFAFMMAPDIGYYTGSMKLFLDAAMEKLDIIDERNSNRLVESFVKAVNIIVECLGRLAFRRSEDGNLNRSLFDSYTVVVAKLPEAKKKKLLRNSERFMDLYVSSLKQNRANSRYLLAITAATARLDNVQKRFEVAEDVIAKALDD
jgi:hypothetical protein